MVYKKLCSKNLQAKLACILLTMRWKGKKLSNTFFVLLIESSNLITLYNYIAAFDRLIMHLFCLLCTITH